MLRIVRSVSAASLAMFLFSMSCSLGTALLAADTSEGVSQSALAEAIIEDTAVTGGLVVHLGCGNGRLTAALAAGEGYLVHGLDADAERVSRTREYIRSQGLYGRVSADTFDGRRLPYVDNLVNLVVAEDLGDVSMDEVMRVLAPLGVAYIGGRKTVKPWPRDIDEWTHFLHGADNNAVANDSVVAPPKRFQWISGPRWARSHDHLSSLSAMVSARGRVFYIIDEAPAASVAFAPEWRLVARDAFSGVLLWKRTIEPWEGHFRPFRTGPTALARRLVAIGDRVFVTLGYGKPITILDAATGETIRDCEATANAMEIAVDEGTLFAVVGDRAPYIPEDTGGMSSDLMGTGRTSGVPEKHWKVWREKAPAKSLVAVEAETGKLLWKRDDSDTRQIMPTAMAVSSGRVFIQNERALNAFDATTGKTLWRAARPVNLDSPGSSAPTLVASGGVVICADREVGEDQQDEDDGGLSVRWHLYPHTAHSTGGEAIAYDAATGTRLWSVTSVENFRAPADIFVKDKLAFVRSNDPGLGTGVDLRTGEVKHRPVEKSPIRDPGTHWRCYRNKATSNYFVLCQRWTEFYDVASGKQTVSNFVRGSCQYGQMPANGLLYAPHHSCSCSIEMDLNSINALAPEATPIKDAAETIRLEKGPAYGSASSSNALDGGGDDWPTYRHDPGRSGTTRTEVNAELAPLWQTTLNGPLTAPVVADKILIAAVPREHSVHALNADSGEPLWTFTAGAAVDSPPTIHRGMVIFGANDGQVYCLRATDGQVVWRYKAAPVDRRIVAYGQVESIWPVHGSVLVEDGVVYATAGRTTQMDGLYLMALDALTGRELVRKRIGRPGFSDILAADGPDIFMRHLRLDRQGAVQPGNVPHLFSPAGFLDDTWWHRTYWQYGTRMPGGYTRWFSVGERRPAGRLMVMDSEKIFGFGRVNQYDYVGSHVGLGKTRYFLYAAARDDFAEVENGAKKTPSDWARKKPDIPTLWKARIDLFARGIVLSGKVLFVAGPPDLIEPAAGDFSYPYVRASAESLSEQRAALDGASGSHLWAVSAADGTKLSETRLPGLPAWDGLISAGGRLYVTMQDGAVRCFAGKVD